jgi:glycosyltransferase involved in cell wall biosynthesis
MATAWEGLMAGWVIRRYRPAAVYLNTALTLPYAVPALDRNLPTAVHLHEVDDWLSHALARYPLLQEQAKSVRWAHCAQRSAALLMQRYPDVQSQFIPSGIDARRIRDAALKPSFENLPDHYLVNCATADHRKGVDIWLRLCEALFTSNNWPDLHFVWVGKVTQNDLIEPYRNQPFFKNVHFVGETDNPHPILKMACLMVLPSRQDAYPLVVLEAQALGVPVVAFDVGDIKDQIPLHHLVRAEDEGDLLLKVQQTLVEQPPILAFDDSRHSIAIARKRALNLLAQNAHPRTDS